MDKLAFSFHVSLLLSVELEKVYSKIDEFRSVNFLFELFEFERAITVENLTSEFEQKNRLIPSLQYTRCIGVIQKAV